MRSRALKRTPVAVLLAGSVLTAAALATPAAAQGQTRAPVVMTLEDALARGAETSPRLAEARARAAAADATLTARRASALPSVTASSGYSRTNHVDEVTIPLPGGGTRVLFPDITNNYRVRGEVSVPIYSFGRVSAALDAARADIDAASADRETAIADVRLDVARAYWTLVMTRETVRVLEQSLDRADAWVGDVKARVDAGVLPPNDVLSAQAQRARQSVRLIQARHDASIAELDLARLTGLAPGTPITVATPAATPLAGIAELEATGPADEDALVERALASRPETAALASRSESLRSNAAVARAGTRPYLVGVAAVEPARPNTRFVPPTDRWRTSWNLGVTFTWPLFDSGRAAAEAKALDQQATAVDARRADVEGLLGIEVRQRIRDVLTTRASIAAAAEAVAAASEARRVVEERFRAGVATSTDVLDAQVAALDAEVEHTRLQASLRLTEARLLRAMGGR